ncbi:GET complex subunit GET2 [Geosmithia morbida]|uniref:GET complex subunit GET2 n=1 Tax=Geosmithia morbida TaxID=1094350 RepID=A0A9P4YVV3_9HYPO|nr:GET complex subunit GET2 [Geosmithia morbida]KAF4123795.1 GET complex subunit GET2 [Geosmithia morbida]
MTETAASTGSEDPAQRAAEQARLRKERREAKLKAGGSARLNKITGLSGRPMADFEPPSATAATPTATTDDPEEVDISEHFHVPKTTERGQQRLQDQGVEPAVSEDALRQMMLGMGPPPPLQQQQQGDGQENANPFGGAAGGDDPIMQMMSQMMGGGAAGAGNPLAGIPGLGDALGQKQKASPPDMYTSLWRLLHGIVALGLGLYIVALTPFTGTRAERELAAADEIQENEERKRLFFWVFATAEACLLTTRFFLDKGRDPPAGIAWTVSGFLPQPFKGYAQMVMRYGQIFTTVRSDILACIFVLGVCAWWRS